MSAVGPDGSTTTIRSRCGTVKIASSRLAGDGQLLEQLVVHHDVHADRAVHRREAKPDRLARSHRGEHLAVGR